MRSGYASERFKVGSVKATNGYRWATIAVCGTCGAQQEIVSSKNKALPVEFVSNKFQQMGWWIGSRKQDDTCPKCVAMNKERRRMKVEETKEPPRIASRDDKRKIRNALDEHYDDSVGHYMQGMTDQRLADKLNVPRAWVSEIREEFFGPAFSEEYLKFSSLTQDLERRCKQVETDALNVASKAENLVDEAKRLRAQIEKSAR